MKIKIIDLFNKIANGEEVPKKILYKDVIYEWKEYEVCYGKIMTKKGWTKEKGYVATIDNTYYYLKHCYQDLNEYVVILETTITYKPDKIEKINVFSYDKCIHEVTHKEKELALEIRCTQIKINELIEAINER